MREFKGQIFLGSGDLSVANCHRLHKRLEEGLSILSALQQPDHPENMEHLSECKNNRRIMNIELKDIADDIYCALLGVNND